MEREREAAESLAAHAAVSRSEAEAGVVIDNIDLRLIFRVQYLFIQTRRHDISWGATDL